MDKASNIARRRKVALEEGSSDYLAKRSELIEIAARLFKQNGFRATTLSEIGQEAGLDRATVYYYFASKEELFREILRTGVEINIRECRRIFADPARDPVQKLEAVIRQMMAAYDEHYPHMYVYIQEEMGRITDQQGDWAKAIAGQTRTFEKIVIDLIVEGRAAGLLRDDIPVTIAANAAFGMVNWTHRWYRPGGKHGADEIGNSFASILLDGMKPG